jgi:hypothetical protein
MNLDIKSVVFGMLLMSIPLAFMAGRIQVYEWKSVANICTAYEEKRNAQIQTLLQNNISVSSEDEPKPLKKKGG